MAFLRPVFFRELSKHQVFQWTTKTCTKPRKYSSRKFALCRSSFDTLNSSAARFQQTPSKRTVLQTLKDMTRVFIDGGVSEPEHSAEHLLAAALNMERTSLKLERSRKVTDEETLQLARMCDLRLQSMPVQYIETGIFGG
mmetsp:Transcript_1461/g.2573  ORF Transcript_1461/g.2573 Transcript_1461/m.2573 type:complete len:140 (+) Transcript_1461:41-460(+)